MEEIIAKLIKFQKDRNWNQFHTPSNLAKSISIESGELLELFQWDDSFNKKEVEEELADVFIYCFYLANLLNINIKDAIFNKIKINEQKYPISKSKNSSIKYNKF